MSVNNCVCAFSKLKEANYQGFKAALFVFSPTSIALSILLYGGLFYRTFITLSFWGELGMKSHFFMILAV